MIEKKVTRYYCEFCRKGGFRKPDMVRHEQSCIMNPNRKCYICEDSHAPDLKNIVEVARREHSTSQDFSEDIDNDWRNMDADGIKWLSEQCGGCPACMLSVLKQARIAAFDAFDYKDAVRNWNAEKWHELHDMVGDSGL